ncbi:glucose-6-phosphate isomerase [Phytophthora cinnamomi]|uniref:glucose-6-phosphate isomerase n=1 Tax=Phytophthora cinnamomi TaxID=4785 RepID=UPI00355A6915|nr:glucose-6-phosphate isomerase [Phytophthora cinnamomi]
MASSSPEFVSVSTPGGSKQMTLAPFHATASQTGTKHKKRKADPTHDPDSNSTGTSTPSTTPAPTAPASTTTATTTIAIATAAAAVAADEGSWRRNLARAGGGFWGDAHWYDLQLERRLPQAGPMLRELVLALPPCGDRHVLDLCAGSGRAAAAVLEAYPTARLTLLDSSAQRLELAAQRLEKLQPGAGGRVSFVTRGVTLTDTAELCTEPVDVVVGCLAFHVLVERPAHYAQGGEGDEAEAALSTEAKYEQLFGAVYRSLRPGGHVVFADHVGQLPLFQQLKALERAGFEDVDCAWCVDGSFVGGGRKPLA